MSLDTWLKTRPDRHPCCGFHPSQGHGEDCAPVAPAANHPITARGGPLATAEAPGQASPYPDGRGSAAGADEWATFTTALRTAARDGVVHQGDVRPLIRGRIAPKHVGTLYRRAKTEGLLRDTGEREPSNDVAGRNTDKLDRIYALVGAA